MEEAQAAAMLKTPGDISGTKRRRSQSSSPFADHIDVDGAILTLAQAARLEEDIRNSVEKDREIMVGIISGEDIENVQQGTSLSAHDYSSNEDLDDQAELEEMLPKIKVGKNGERVPPRKRARVDAEDNNLTARQLIQANPDLTTTQVHNRLGKKHGDLTQILPDMPEPSGQITVGEIEDEQEMPPRATKKRDQQGAAAKKQVVEPKIQPRHPNQWDAGEVAKASKFSNAYERHVHAEYAYDLRGKLDQGWWDRALNAQDSNGSHHE